MSRGRRGLEDLLADLAEAVDAAAELVGLGKARWDAERPLRLAGEAVVGRIRDISTKLPEELTAGTSQLPWAEIKGMRIVVELATAWQEASRSHRDRRSGDWLGWSPEDGQTVEDDFRCTLCLLSDGC